jgi:hypothetical protein
MRACRVIARPRKIVHESAAVVDETLFLFEQWK